MARQVSRPRITCKDIEDLSIPTEIADSLCSCGGIEGLVDRIPSDDLFIEMRGWYQACADPVRLKILSLLMVQPLCVCVIKSVVKMADSKLSYHLTILKKAGMIEGYQQGNYIIYQITQDAKCFMEEELRRFGRNKR
ncbi:MAG: metalloregulator ArsR/SmtB family transcription factor [Methanoregulaceae archaeon]|nr:metalloregulator ArsR/SmtB family transcription factor [Methanoregulaceae archaeon]